MVYVTQVPGGEVTDVRVGECNGDAAVRQSIESRGAARLATATAARPVAVRSKSRDPVRAGRLSEDTRAHERESEHHVRDSMAQVMAPHHCRPSFGLCAVPPARAQLQIEITQGVSDPIPIAVVPFSRAVPADGGLDVVERRASPT